MDNGKLVISLDFELLWGVFDKVVPSEKIEYFENTRRAIPKILDLFRAHEIHCTWAIVGMLFNNNEEEWRKNFPNELPMYEKKELSPYIFADSYLKKGESSLLFAPEIIKLIANSPFQEIGTHTYGHYYCLENGQDLNSFKADLSKSIDLAEKEGIKISSLVFPRNQYNEEYLNICHELGISSVRSNPYDWYWDDTSKDTILKKVFRTGDAYFGILNKSYKLHTLKLKQGQPLSQKASRLLRPHSSFDLLNKLRTKRIKNEMENAAKNNEIYHLWWHPHNFGNNTSENLSDLAEILAHFSYCRSKYNFQSSTMNDIYNLLNS